MTDAFEIKAKRISKAGQALAELEHLISTKVKEWEMAGLVEVLSLEVAISNVVKQYCENFNSSNTNNTDSIATTSNKRNPWS